MSTRSVLTWSSLAACSTGPLTQAWIQSVLNSARHFSLILFFFSKRNARVIFFFTSSLRWSCSLFVNKKTSTSVWIQVKDNAKLWLNPGLSLDWQCMHILFGVLVSSFPLKQCLNNDLLNFTLKSFSCLLENYVCFSIFCKW